MDKKGWVYFKKGGGWIVEEEFFLSFKRKSKLALKREEGRMRREAAVFGLFFGLLIIKKTSKVGFISVRGFSGKERRGTKVVSCFFFLFLAVREKKF